MIAFKGFEPGLICRGYPFVLGRNVTDKANCRQNGFHCAENPLDCLTYYPDIAHAEFYIVHAGGDLDEDGQDSKISCTELTILKKLTAKELLLHGLAYMADHPLRKLSVNAQWDRGKARGGYAVVRGIDPAASGQLGDILAFAREDAVSGRIMQVAVATVDGGRILPDRWYSADFMEREVREP